MTHVHVRYTEDDDTVDELRALNTALLPGSPPHEDTDWWGVWVGGSLVGYAGARAPAEWPGVYFLSRAGITEQARGQGLQRRLVRARVARARRLGCHSCITYTSPDNAASMRTLIACGFKPYVPEPAYVGDAYVYWRKAL
jgi:RimJ/RimL family protein N-acetyltransferase